MTRLRRWALALCAIPALVLAQPQRPAWEAGSDGLAPIPALAARVTDLTPTLSAADRQLLETKLADWEARTGNQLAVLLVPTTQPEPLEAYSIRVAEAWKLGRKGNDNGVLFTVAVDDKRMRIEVGYGLEGTLTDVTSRRIIAEDVAPLFREGKFAAGINAGVDRIVKVVDSGTPLPAAPDAKRKAASSGFDFETLLVIVFVVVPVVGMALRSIFGKLAGSSLGGAAIGFAAWFLIGSLVVAVIAGIIAFLVMIFSGFDGGMRGRRGGGPWLPSGGGGWGGGGFSGGGGGFSGGGGSFGGGGASGGWD